VANLVIAASGFEPIQRVLQNFSVLFFSLTILVVGGGVIVFLIRIGLATQQTSVEPNSYLHPINPAPIQAFERRSLLRSERPLAIKLRAIDWFQFEKLTEVVFRKKGYSVDRRGGANSDGGIDLVIMKEGEKIAVQCKHWKTSDIGVAIIRELVGAMQDSKIPKGMLVTISRCTNDAQACAERNGVQIIDHAAMVNLLESVDASYDQEIQELLNDGRKVCPKCERLMVLRKTKQGPNAGRQFWGCSTYPACKHMERI